ncbi:NAD(P)H-dependent glycerol-3-phosphate dehydrogenase [Streptomyces sp. UNOC14_S4]|uniref:NAD(P)H-dependent glycerol-3-phosphate dehydrogenase n=1 Tax=Streptomyces sp. UNOC14_S4 TaxID=2872340 RepID=UPI001E609471|nr:NAD(P)H-dependent glycerol-3-phosphate dehydrogenase [Streptomyces sp. UNOC14_S4]MCC3769663.1 NAD(P)-dependent glycerol-3-phosphate dehydrogenase [Streptomyces sp. UNOC14_S4]
MTRASVFGAGSWGTAVAMILADAGCRVTMWARRREVAEAITTGHTNPEYFPDVALPPAITATTDAAAAAEDADIAVLAVTAQTLRDNLAHWGSLLGDEAVLLSLMKGIEVGTGLRMTEIIAETTKAAPERIVVLTGPNLAREITARQPAAAVIACPDQAVATRLQNVCRTPYFRPYTSTDVVGCELGGAVKNVIALAVGIADGMGLGNNAKGALVTRGLAETTRLGRAMGADPLTFAGLAGMGDLVATCASPLSRNHTFGAALGRGLNFTEAATAAKHTAEGVTSCVSVLDLARRHGVEMPITETVVGIIHDGTSPHAALGELMARSATSER